MSEDIGGAIEHSEAEVRQLLDRRDTLRVELNGIEAALTKAATWRASVEPAGEASTEEIRALLRGKREEARSAPPSSVTFDGSGGPFELRPLRQPASTEGTK